jgi:hypothetical protein
MSSVYISFTIQKMYIKQFYSSFLFPILMYVSIIPSLLIRCKCLLSCVLHTPSHCTPLVKVTVLLGVLLCYMVDWNHCFGDTCCLHLRVEVWSSSVLLLSLCYNVGNCIVSTHRRKNGTFQRQERYHPRLIFTAQFSNVYLVVTYIQYVSLILFRTW